MSEPTVGNGLPIGIRDDWVEDMLGQGPMVDTEVSRSIVLPSALNEQAKRKAKTLGVSVSALMRMALRRYLRSVESELAAHPVRSKS